MFWSLFVNDMIGDKDHKGGIVAAVLMMIWCLFVFISLQWLLSVDPDTVNSSSSLHSIRQHVHGLSSRVHDIIWKHVLRLDSSSGGSGGSGGSGDGISGSGGTGDGISCDGISCGERSSTINEAISPFGSLNSTTNTATTAKVV